MKPILNILFDSSGGGGQFLTETHKNILAKNEFQFVFRNSHPLETPTCFQTERSWVQILARYSEWPS